jgi:RNA recognition motif-containing protein
MNNKELQGKAITLSIQTQGSKNFDPKANVFVRNLAKEVTQEQLYKMFADFGPI